MNGCDGGFEDCGVLVIDDGVCGIAVRFWEFSAGRWELVFVLLSLALVTGFCRGV